MTYLAEKRFRSIAQVPLALPETALTRGQIIQAAAIQLNRGDVLRVGWMSLHLVNILTPAAVVPVPPAVQTPQKQLLKVENVTIAPSPGGSVTWTVAPPYSGNVGDIQQFSHLNGAPVPGSGPIFTITAIGTNSVTATIISNGFFYRPGLSFPLGIWTFTLVAIAPTLPGVISTPNVYSQKYGLVNACISTSLSTTGQGCNIGLNLPGVATLNPYYSVEYRSPGIYYALVGNNASNVDASVVLTGTARVFRA